MCETVPHSAAKTIVVTDTTTAELGREVTADNEEEDGEEMETANDARLRQMLSQSPSFRASKSPPEAEGGFDSSAFDPDSCAAALDKLASKMSSPPREPLDDATIPRVLRQSVSGHNIEHSIVIDVKNEAKVLVLYTGGTIGMVRNAEGALVPQPHAMEAMIRTTVTMHDREYSALRFHDTRDVNERRMSLSTESLLPLVLPSVPNHKRVIYTIYEYDPLLDSSNMTMDDWIQISKDIRQSYEIFDGFVILHGTDTLAYTASALSFMLENLGKPVIVTGSQIPCFETRSDGRDNFVGALILAGNYQIPEVGVYFRHQLLRGNRTIKVSSGELDAFKSPNMTPLVKLGIEIEVDHKAIHRPKSIKKFTVNTRLNRNVVLLRLFPSIRGETFAHFLSPPIQGVVLQCYGAGNVPINRKDIMESIREANQRGVIILSVTQCVTGGVSGLYETGKALLDLGVIPGGDITPEAALTKLSYVLSKSEWSLEQKRKMMMTNTHGEMTMINVKEFSKPEHDDTGELELIQAVAKSLHLETSEELHGVETVLFPSILCSAVFKGSMDTLKALKAYGADLSGHDYDMRTPLHVAASEGNAELVEYLLHNGASVHARDRTGDTPLGSAINGAHDEVVKLLVDCGAHLQVSQPELGETLCFLARNGNTDKLRSYKLAGANLNARNMTLNTALHSAVETGQTETVQFLLRSGARVDGKNCYGKTPADIATVLRRVRILDILEAETNNDI